MCLIVSIDRCDSDGIAECLYMYLATGLFMVRNDSDNIIHYV